MKQLWYKAKEIWWKIILTLLLVGALILYFYRLLRPAENKSEFLNAIKTEATAALKENELRGRLEKDKAGALRVLFEHRLNDVSRIKDREERLEALIRLHKELDI